MPILNQRQTAQALGISAPRLKALTDEAKVPRLSDGRYDLEQVRTAWARNRDPKQPTKIHLATPPEAKPAAREMLAAEIKAAPGESRAEQTRQAALKLAAGLKEPRADGTYLQLQTRFLAVKMAKAAIELEKIAGRLVDSGEVEKIAFNTARHARDSLLAWPSRISALLAAELACDERVLYAGLERHIREFLIERSAGMLAGAERNEGARE